MMEVVAFKSMWHWRIVLQLEIDVVGKSYAAYAGVLEPDETQRMFRPFAWGGEGMRVPDGRRENLSPSQAREYFPQDAAHYDAEGYYYR